MTVPYTLDQAMAVFAEQRGILTLAALGLVVVTLALTVRRAVKGGRPDRWVDVVAFLGALVFSAEGMWEVATQSLGLPATFAALVFFLFEAQLVSAMFRANRYQRLNGNPGRHGRAVWLIACVMGGIVAFAADSFVEAPLRLAIPLLAAYQWWLGLTADGVTEDAGAVSWRWTPRRLMLRIGAIEPGERDVVTVDRERRVAAMTVAAHRLHANGVMSQWHAARLRRLALTADDDMVAEARSRVERVWRVAAMTRPVDTGRDITATRDMAAEDVDTDADDADAPDESAGGATSGVQLSATQAAMMARSLKTVNPDMDADTIAVLVGRSARQVKRYLEPPALTQTNGHSFTSEVANQ